LINAVSGIGKLVTGKPFLPQEIMDMFALNWNFSNAKARQALGWEPLTYRQAMTETWQEYQVGGWKPG
jgi:hypothetical protein